MIRYRERIMCTKFKKNKIMNNKEKYLHKILDAVVGVAVTQIAPEANAYVDEHGLVYKEPKYGE